MAFFRVVILLALEIALCNIPLVLTSAQHSCASTIYSEMMSNVWDSSEQWSAVGNYFYVNIDLLVDL